MALTWSDTSINFQFMENWGNKIYEVIIINIFLTNKESAMPTLIIYS